MRLHDSSGSELFNNFKNRYIIILPLHKNGEFILQIDKAVKEGRTTKHKALSNLLQGLTVYCLTHREFLGLKRVKS